MFKVRKRPKIQIVLALYLFVQSFFCISVIGLRYRWFGWFRGVSVISKFGDHQQYN